MTSPTAAWVWRQLLEATPRGRQPSYLIHDRDAVYGADHGTRAKTLGVVSVRTPPRPPMPNEISRVAEAEGHHPDLYVRGGEVRVYLWTHKIDGLTESDFVMVAKTASSAGRQR